MTQSILTGHQVWLLNSLGTRANPGGKSPFEMRFGRPRDISGVPEWGAPCYVFDLETGKLEPNAERVYWLGFDGQTPTKGHRLYSKKGHKVRVEPAVKFLRVEPDREEEVFVTDVGDLFWDDVDRQAADPGEDVDVDPADGSAPGGPNRSLPAPRTPVRAQAPVPAPDAPQRPRARAERFAERLAEVDVDNIVEGTRVRKPSQYVRDVLSGTGTIASIWPLQTEGTGSSRSPLWTTLRNSATRIVPSILHQMR